MNENKDTECHQGIMGMMDSMGHNVFSPNPKITEADFMYLAEHGHFPADVKEENRAEAVTTESLTALYDELKEKFPPIKKQPYSFVGEMAIRYLLGKRPRAGNIELGLDNVWDFMEKPTEEQLARIKSAIDCDRDKYL